MMGLLILDWYRQDYEFFYYEKHNSRLPDLNEFNISQP